MYSGQLLIAESEPSIHNGFTIGHFIKQIRILGMMPHPSYPPSSGTMLVRFFPYFIAAKNSEELNDKTIELPVTAYHIAYEPDDSLAMSYMEEIKNSNTLIDYHSVQH
jgi:hypothetical protein